MEEKLKKSIDRAIVLLKTPPDYEKYISIKLSLLSENCWSCYWGKTWGETKRAIGQLDTINHKDDVLIKKDGNIFVLEQQESGPEILVYLKSAIDFTKSVIDFITTIIKGLSKEPKKQPSRIKISKRQIIQGVVNEESLIEIDLPLSKDIEKQLQEKLKNLFNKKP